MKLGWWNMQKQRIMLKILIGCLSKLLIPFFLILGLSCSYVSAKTLFVATTGTNSGTCTNQSSPCRTISYGISQMSGGDTLIIGDGTYTDAITGVPNGSAGAYTTVRAANTGGVLLSGFSGFGIRGNGSYKIFDGIKVNGGLTNIPVYIDGRYIKAFRIAAYGAPQTGNIQTFIVGSGSSNILVEECWAWGTGRYQFLVYQANNVVVRRCVSRHDYHEGFPWSDQCAPFVMYESNQVHWQNIIAVDSGPLGGRLYGGIWCENNGGVETNGSVKGSIFLNLHASAINNGKQYGTMEVEDVVSWDCNGGYHAYDYGTESQIQHVTLNRVTSGNMKKEWEGGGSVGMGARCESANIETRTIKNSILLDNPSYGIGDYLISNYNVYWGNASNFKSPATAGAADYCSENGNAFDPETNGLLYLPRVEEESTLASAGNGGQAGARIMYKIGTSGTLYGEEGWDTLTADELWPFPNEDLIRSDIRSYSGPGPSGKRGFCADGQTLTKYIWEYLGNSCPLYICSDPGSISAPSAPTNFRFFNP
jgi:hypothetical protein